MKTGSSPVFLGILLLSQLSIASLLYGQTTTSTLEGKVLDQTGAVLLGASVEVKGATVSRTVVSNEAGFYRAVALPAGNYTVTVSLSGFKTRVLEGVILLLDRTVTLDIQMEVAEREEFVTVQAEMPLINYTSSSAGQVIDARTIDSIPLNGRNYLDLILLTPGVATNDNARSDLSSRDARGAILGERAGNTAFLIDGLENNDDFRGGVFQAYTQDTIQEFEVIETGYKAEFGRGSGGVVNVITKSGSTELKGSGFFYTRNDALDASNVEGEQPPELARYNAGFTAGGPLARDRSWFFGSLEYIGERRGAIFPPNIPDVLKAGEDFSRQPESGNYRLFGKYTERVNNRNDLRAEASWTRLKNEGELLSATSLPSASNNNLTKTFLANVSLTSLLGSELFLDSSFGVRDQRFDQNQDAPLGASYSIFFLDEGSSFDFGAGLASALDQRYLTAREVLNLFSGDRHAAKLGFEYTRTVVNGVDGQQLFNVIVTTRANFGRYGRDSFQIPQGVGFFNPGDDLTRLRNNAVGFFAQDDWRVMEKLTLNLGVRYDYDSRFGDTNNVAPRLGLSWNPDEKTVVRTSWGLFYDRYRLGIAQAVPELGGVNGRTVAELDYPRLIADALLPFPGSLGLLTYVFGDPFLLHNQFGIPLDAVIREDNIEALTGLGPDEFLAEFNGYLASLGIPFLPVDFSPATGFLRQDLSAAFIDVVRVARPFKTPYNNSFMVGFQRALRPDLSAGASYVHRRIRNILGLRLTNLDPVSREIGPPPLTNDGGPLQRSFGPWYDGKYDALILTMEKRFRGRYQFQANYTYSKATDNLLNSNLGVGVLATGGGAVPTDSLDLEVDRGNSDLAVPHAFVVSGVVSLPAGFWVSGVLRATSGVHFSAAGEPIDYDGDGIVSTRPRGTRRNEFRGPATGNLDLRVEKRFGFAKRYTASVLVEFFNLTNARNPRLIDNFFVDGQPGPRFGETRVPLPGREMQIGLRFQF